MIMRRAVGANLLTLFLMVLLGLAILAVPFTLGKPSSVSGQESVAVSKSELKEALFYERLPEGEVQCGLCPRECLLREGERGDCRVRVNLEGRLYSLVYGKPCALSLEPIEKAPLFHFMPGHKRLCVATAGCNLRCRYCQNWHISQRNPEEVESADASPEAIVEQAIASGARSICFTFSEPVVFYEYMYDIARLGKSKGLKTSMVSAGYINPEPLENLLEVLDAVKIDLKAFDEEFYEDITKGTLEPVLNTLETIRRKDTWLEIVNLVVPTLNDDPKGIKRMCEWIRDTLGAGVPLHFSRFFPMYRLTDLPATPITTLERAHLIALEAGLEYVYIGNVPGHMHNSTYCPSCGKRLIHRVQYSISERHLKEGRCAFCGEAVEGVW
jgi:pyruvate formate lyase activating enzyme